MNLKEIRQKRGLTLRSLSSLSGIGASTIGNYENGKTTISETSLKRIASALDVSIDAIREPVSTIYGALERARADGGWRMETQVIEEVRARIEQFPYVNLRARKLFMEQIVHRLQEYGAWCDGHYSEHRQEIIDHAREKDLIGDLDAATDKDGTA